MGYNHNVTSFFFKELPDRPRGMTMVELVMVIAIIGVLSLAGSAILMFFVENAVTTPQDLTVNMAASRVVDHMIDGDGQAAGLRFSRGITTANANQVVFLSAAGDTVSYRYDSGAGWTYRSVNGSSEEPWPHYQLNTASMEAPDGAMFVYADANGNTTNVAANVRLITVRVRVLVGPGSDPWSSNVQMVSAVQVQPY